MTSEELINHLLYEYGTKTVSRNNYNEEKLKATQEIKEDLEVLKIMSKYFGWLNFDNMEESEKTKIMNYYLKKGKIINE